METTLERKRPHTLTRARDRLAEPKGQRETLDQAKTRLAELRKTAAANGIQLPPWSAETRTTLTKVTDLIEELEQEIASAGVTSPPKTEIKPAPETLERAREFLAKPALPASDGPAKTITSQPPVSTDPRGMTASQLERAIESEKDIERRGPLFRELNARWAKQPTRRIIESTANMTVSELEAAIDAEKDPEQRQMLFWQLSRRTARKR
jgi:hypothetical protein